MPKNLYSVSDLSSYVFKLPLSVFVTNDDKMLARLDDLHKSVPSELPAKRLFRN